MPPVFPGFRARHWHLEQRAIRGRYLIGDPTNAAHFLQSPLAADASLARIGRYQGVAELAVESNEAVPEVEFYRPVFIVSAPRAGSTLLFDLLAESAKLWSVGRESDGIIEGIPELHPSRHDYASHRLTKVDPFTADTLRAAFLAELCDRQGQRYLALPNGRRPMQVQMLEKTPENALRIPMLVAAFPNACFIYLLREARQNVSSMVEAWQHSGFINVPQLPGWKAHQWHLLLPPGWQAYEGRPIDEIAAFQWASANETILDDLALLSSERWIAVDYDDLLAEPEKVLQRICDFIGIPFDQDLTEVARRPLRLSATTIHYPSRSRWRYNRDFRELVLRPFGTVIKRMDGLRCKMTTTIKPRRRAASVQFRCFLDEIDEPVQAGGKDNPITESAQALVVDPTFELQFGTTIPLSLVQRTRFRERFMGNTPIVWVEDPATQMLCPFWIRHEDAWPLRDLRAGKEPERSLPAKIRRMLQIAGILETAAEREQHSQLGDMQAQDAAAWFATRDFCVISHLLNPAYLPALARYYAEMIQSGVWRLGDAQVAGRYGWHNEPLARFFHHQLAHYIGRVAGVQVKPSYAYVSFYQAGAVLERHVDREQCEFTLSLLVEQKAEGEFSEWPIYFDTPEGTVELFQSAGEAILFRGAKLPHYRPPLANGQTYLSLLFHYVSREFHRTLY